MSQESRTMKILIVGDSGTGKSHLLLRFTQETFSPGSVPTTVGVDYRMRTVLIDGHPVKLQIWDTAGLERFRAVTEAYFRGAGGVLVCYDVTNRKSFENIPQWMRSLESRSSTAIKMLCGNKCDSPLEKREVPLERGKAFAQQHGMMFLETSGFAGTNVEEAFMSLATSIFHAASGDVPQPLPAVATTATEPATPKRSPGCCGK